MGKNLLKCLLAVSAIGLLLSGCSKKTSTKDTSSSGETKKEENKNQGKEKVTLSLWAGEEDKDYIAVVTENFIKENADKADITIDWKPVIEGQCRICTNLVRMLAFVTCPFFVFQQKNPQNTQERHPQKEG